MIKMKTFLCLFVMITQWVTGQTLSLNTDNKEIFLIITTEPLFKSVSLNKFISFREKEFNVKVVTNTSIGTTPEQFRTYIRNQMPSYVLLVGDYEDFPTYIIPYKKVVESFNYYVASSLTGHPKPDIPLGLFLVKNETELGNIVDKTIYTENNISLLPKIYYAHAGSIEPLWPWPLEFNEEILTEMNNKYFAPAGYEFYMATAADNTPNDARTDIQMINKGVGFVIYHGHGVIHKWSFGLGVGGLGQLNNSTFPFVFSLACLTGTFSGEINGHTADCYASKMVASPNGAVAFIGAYNVSCRGQNPLLEGLCSGIFNDNISRLGDALLYAFNSTTLPNTVSKYYPIVTERERTRTAWQFHLFGDPAIKIKVKTTSVTDPSSKKNSIQKHMPMFYPNPTTGLLNTNLQSIDKISVYNSIGQKIDVFSNPNQIDLSKQNNGIYYLKVRSKGKWFKEKIIKIE